MSVHLCHLAVRWNQLLCCIWHGEEMTKLAKMTKFDYVLSSESWGFCSYREKTYKTTSLHDFFRRKWQLQEVTWEESQQTPGLSVQARSGDQALENAPKGPSAPTVADSHLTQLLSHLYHLLS